MIDVVIPTSDNWKHLELCLRALERHTRNAFHAIIVDGGSSDPATIEVLADAKIRGHTVVTIGSSRSFSKSINAGLAVSKGEHVCLLNDDAFVTAGWDSVMLSDLADSSIGAVGALMPGGAAGLQGGHELLGVIPPKFLVMAHLMTRRDVLNKIGNLDAETFDGYGSEDLDWCFRVRDAGYKLKISDTKTLHVGGASMDRLPAGRMREYNRMHRKLVEKWGKERVTQELRLIPRVALAIPTYNGKVDNDFFQSFAMLQKTGAFEMEIFQTKRLVVHYAREAIVESVLSSDRFDYVWWLDDDMVFPMDTLTRLVAHQKPVVTALAYQRREPYNPCIFDWTETPKHLRVEGGENEGLFNSIRDAEHTGLRRIDGLGSACVLVETRVYRDIERAGRRPWYSNKSFGEDLHFARLCMKAKASGMPGFEMYCDTDLIVGHLGDQVLVDEAHVARYKAWKSAQARQAEPVFAR